MTVEEAAVRAVGKTTADAFGYDDQRRRIARELGVDPYSTNPVLTQRLDDIAAAAFAGGLGISAFKAAAPGGMIISSTTTLSDWVWDQAPGDLKVQNERSLLAMGVTQAQVDLLPTVGTVRFVESPQLAEQAAADDKRGGFGCGKPGGSRGMESRPS